MSRAEMRNQAQRGGGRRGGAGGGGRGGKPGKKGIIDYPRAGKTGWRRWVPSWKQVLSLFLIFFGSLVGTIGVAYAMTPVPNAKDLQGGQSNTYYWDDGVTVMVQKGNGKQYATIDQISRPAQEAVIAAENETFRTDSGIDPKGMARAVYLMATGGDTQGGSTITQQYVKNAYLTQEQSITRKLKEFFITLKLNGKVTKEKILEGYLNIAWYGHGATGIQAASKAYFDMDAKDLDACHGAMLAGLLKGAAVYDPTLNQANHDRMFGPSSSPQSGRWEWILSRMVVTKAITQDDMNKCIAAGPPEIKKGHTQSDMGGQIGYLVDTADSYLVSKGLQQAQIDRGGYKIYTTFNKDKVDALSKAVNDVMSTRVDPRKRPDTDQFVQAGAASVVPGDGKVVAIYGGPGIDQGHYVDNATTEGVPVGSTWKPINLSAAMTYGVRTKKNPNGNGTPISPDSLYLADDNTIIKNPDGTNVLDDKGQPFHQHNDEQGNKPGYVTLKASMTQSFNVPYVQLGEDVGGTNVTKMAGALGVDTNHLAPINASFFIGTSGQSPLRMASVYATFAAHGQQAEPYSVTKVLDKTGAQVPNIQHAAPTKALDPAVADNITDVLQTVINDPNGTAYTNGRKIGRPAAGKTGTTDEYKSAWFDGYVPQLATSVGMFREDPQHPGLLSLKGTAGNKNGFYGGDLPTQIWAEYMGLALNGVPVQDFPPAQPVGTAVNQSGAPSTASPTASPSASPSASTVAPSPSTKPSVTAPPSTDQGTGPTDMPSQPSCGLLFGCPTTAKPKGTKSSSPPTGAPSGSASPAAAPPAGQ